MKSSRTGSEPENAEQKWNYHRPEMDRKRMMKPEDVVMENKLKQSTTICPSLLKNITFTLIGHFFLTDTFIYIFRGERKMLYGSSNPDLDLKVNQGHGLGRPPWYRSIPDGTNIYFVLKTRLTRTYDKSIME